MPAQYGPDVDSNFILGRYLEDFEWLAGLDLDPHNGRFCVTPDYPAGTYAYFLTLDEHGDPAFRYTIGSTFYGTPSNGTRATIPLNGVTDAPTPGHRCLHAGLRQIREKRRHHRERFHGSESGLLQRGAGGELQYRK